MAQIEIWDVHKTFDSGKTALEGVSFAVADGEFVSLLGPSGCGKTTLLRIVAGLDRATGGHVAIGGRDVTDDPPKDRDIAMVFQSYALYPHLSVSENIGMGLRLRGVEPGAVRERVGRSAGKLGLVELLDRKPSTLSGGQRQRVALARALVRDPKAFLLDEPLSNLDAVLRERTRGELKLLFKAVRGTVLYVTHDQVEAMTLSDRIVVLNEGRVQQVGTPEEIYHEPANTFVAGFLGAPPMNVIPLSIAEGAELAAGDPARDADKLLLGVRPEDVLVSTRRVDGAARAKVVLAEPTGPHTVLTLDFGGATLRAAVPGTWADDAEPWVRLPPAKLRFFDAGTRRRV